MKTNNQKRAGVALLHPWSFGPPLRGRVLQHNTSTLAYAMTESPSSCKAWGWLALQVRKVIL
jgi:hypothetical protein